MTLDILAILDIQATQELLEQLATLAILAILDIQATLAHQAKHQTQEQPEQQAILVHQV